MIIKKLDILYRRSKKIILHNKIQYKYFFPKQWCNTNGNNMKCKIMNGVRINMNNKPAYQPTTPTYKPGDTIYKGINTIYKPKTYNYEALLEINKEKQVIIASNIIYII